MIKRDLTPRLKQSAKEFGVVSVTGPRQSGKTTLVKNVFPDHKYINLESLAELSLIREDPLSFVKSIKTGVIVDEVQKFPDILSYIQVSIDEDFKPGKFIVTGSQNLLLSEKISQSLAGRVAVLKLLPLTIEELKRAGRLGENYSEVLLKGFYPGLYDKKQSPNIFYSGYIQTYAERDVRTLKNIRDLASFERFLQLLAGRVGQLVNLTQLGNITGVSHKTIESWLSVLEASYMIMRLQPYYNNFGRRIVKSPKIYFTDVGMVSYLLGIDSEEGLRNHFALGGLFENMVVLDFYKRKLNELSSSKLYFLRDSGGHEVDLLLDKGVELAPVEIKASSSFNKNFLEGINFFRQREDRRLPFGKGCVVYSGDIEREVNETVLVNWRNLNKIVL